jgi:thioredoxin-like negative regulator of GroEL
VETLMNATVGAVANLAESARSATAALASVFARRTGVTMILFRDDQGGCDTLVATMSEVIRGFADSHPPIQIDIRDQPALAALYNVQTTPTILLVKDGEVVDRVIGRPTRILLQSLLEARTCGRSLLDRAHNDSG